MPTPDRMCTRHEVPSYRRVSREVTVVGERPDERHGDGPEPQRHVYVVTDAQGRGPGYRIVAAFSLRMAAERYVEQLRRERAQRTDRRRSRHQSGELGTDWTSGGWSPNPDSEDLQVEAVPLDPQLEQDDTE